MLVYRTLLFLLCLSFLLLSGHGTAQYNTQLYDGGTARELSGSVYYLYETDTELTIDSVIKRKNDFRMPPNQNPNFGFRNKGMWLLTSITNVSNQQDWVFTINFSQLDKVNFYIVQEQTVVDMSAQGKLQSEQIFRVPTHSASLPEGVTVDIYIRIESQSSSLIAPLKISPQPVHAQTYQVDSMLWGLFYGGLVILAVYNLVLYFGTREPSLLAYVGYICAVILWQYIWGGHIHLFCSEGISPWLTKHTELIFVVIGICSGLFTVSFLETKDNAATAHPVIMLLLYVQIAVGLVCVFDLLTPIWKNNLVYGVGLMAICSYIYAGFEAFLHQFKPARYFIFAWSLLASGAIIGMLSLIGVLPSNDFTTYCFQIGVFLEASLFSVALMEKSRSQLELEVQQATDDLRNNMELIEEQNVRLDIARKDAIKASNVKSQFLANMSHEIRTPLNAILGFSRELAQASLPTDQQEQARIIDTAADNLLTIVNDVLDFSKIEAGKLQINNQPFSPNKLLEETVTIMAKSCHTKRLEFVFELAPLPDKLIGDMFRIKQILNNLLSNALKFTSTGTITLSAKGRSLPHGIHELELIVEDTGIGISRQDKKKLFNAFSQVDDALNRNYQGTGLGLVISRELVRLMRGELHLKSTPGLGSIFTVTIRTNHLSQHYALTPQPLWQNKQVVLFDPVPATRRASAAMLDALGANVYAFESLVGLASIDFSPDYLMATVPVSKMPQRDLQLSKLIQFQAKKKVLWYSGPEPFTQYQNLTQYFHAQVRMPMTPSKLDSLINRQVTPVKSQHQEQLNALPKARILAVDDMDMNLKLLNTWLMNSAVTLTTCTSGQEAVQYCQTQEFDLILMDVQMPVMDGLQASRAIRKTALNMGTPIIAVTAHAFREEQERLLSSGMDDYLPKPIELSSLLALIKAWCHTADPSQIVLPSLDWNLALKRANQNYDAAKDVLNDFIALVPTQMKILEQHWESEDFALLKDEIHKLHGACCYTGVPRLQNLANELESALKLGQHHLVNEHLPILLEELKQVSHEGTHLLNTM